MKLLRKISQPLSRVTLGIISLLTLCWFLWPTSNWEFQLERLIALITSLSVWIGSEFSESFGNSKIEIHPHDKKLLEKFRSQISGGIKLFLSEHDFRNPLNIDEISGLTEIYETWRGARFEFEQSKTNNAFQKFLKINSKFCNLASDSLSIIYDSTKILSVQGELDKSNGLSQDTKNQIHELNQTALELYEAINTFERVARKQLGL